MNSSLILKICFFLFLIFQCRDSFSQNSKDLFYVRQSFISEKTGDYSKMTNADNEYKLFFSGLFLLYKGILSSQDIPGACSFSPSCSEYGLLSIKKKGLILGIISTFDRLTRCNGIAPDQYHIDEQSGKFIDGP